MSLYKWRETDNIKGKKNPQEIFHETTQRLFELLITHPHFIESIDRLRKRYKIKVNEIASISDLLVWQSKRKKTRDRIINERKLESLLEDFTIPTELRAAVNSIAYDYLLTNKITNAPYDSGLNVIKVTEDTKTVELNPNHLYIEVTPYTTIREVKDRWKQITESRKEKRGYGIPATSPIEERVWQLYQEGLSSKEVTTKLNEKRDKVKYQYNEVLTLKNNYKQALSKLKPIK